ncbi:hypothetical protein ACFW2V_13945 [Streptomyces sp. NPDC058947]|uniref:hypothetical protein n=1 Tax=Streptomyces sp. NPDC058947 TaxID=3346675 RepID=UPI0036A827DE
MGSVTDYTNFALDTTGLYDSGLSLDEECDRVRDAWRDAMRSAELHVGLGGFKRVVGEKGRILLAWFQGGDERIYCVIYDPSNRTVTNEPMVSGIDKRGG